MFVIMKSTGEYSARDETALYVVRTETGAQTLVKVLSAEAIAEASETLYRADLRDRGYKLYEQANVHPITSFERPIFDRSREKDKEYIKEHTERRSIWQKNENEWLRTTLNPWYEARTEYAEKYVAENFDPTKIVSKPDYYDLPTFYYTQVELVEEA